MNSKHLELAALPVYVEQRAVRAMLITEENRHLIPSWVSCPGLNPGMYLLVNAGDPSGGPGGQRQPMTLEKYDFEGRFYRVPQSGVAPVNVAQPYIKRDVMVAAQYYLNATVENAGTENELTIPADSYRVVFSYGPDRPERITVMSAAAFEAEYRPAVALDLAQ